MRFMSISVTSMQIRCELNTIKHRNVKKPHLSCERFFMFTLTIFNRLKTTFCSAYTSSNIITRMLLLSWLYALCSQIIIPLPFNLVPLSSQPGPVFLAALLFGWEAVGAYVIYLAQGACGAPFFAGLQGGIVRLAGPTGGYLFGFLFGMIFLVVMRHAMRKNLLIQIFTLITAWAIAFSCGIAQLAFIVPAHKLLSAGFFPFLIGDFGIKLGALLIVLRTRKK